MKHLTLFVLVSLLLCGCTYNRYIMQPWIGLTEETLVEHWGYPASQNDIVIINDHTKAYTYRSTGVSTGGYIPVATQCTVTFTIKDGIITFYRYSGSNCPRIRAPH